MDTIIAFSVLPMPKCSHFTTIINKKNLKTNYTMDVPSILLVYQHRLVYSDLLLHHKASSLCVLTLMKRNPDPGIQINKIMVSGTHVNVHTLFIL
jgi:hypothetical protein